MIDDPFDPFDLPSSFDPLGSENPPPPRRRRGPAPPTPTAGAGGRLAHFLEPVRPPGDDPVTRLASLETQVAILTARLDALEALFRAPEHEPVKSLDAVRGKHTTGKGAARKTRLPPFLR